VELPPLALTRVPADAMVPAQFVTVADQAGAEGGAPLAL
jgi:hypothetical protein